MNNVINIADIRAQFESQKQDLRRAASARDAIAAERRPDVMDNLRDAVDHLSAAALIERRLDQIRQVDAALNRLNPAQYGICAECEKPISPQRLAAIPTAVLCITCRTGSERMAA